jgi:NAD(P)-dependent dehydrogenase (short-subunit alcohol dehydrogenase family)
MTSFTPKINMEHQFTNKIAIVTGAGRGIGQGIAVLFANQGAKVAIADRDESSARQTVQQIQQHGGETIYCPLDLARVDSIRAMVDQVVRQWSRIDFLVNAAGVIQAKQLLDVTEADWDPIIAVNQKGLFFCVQAVARQMIRQIPPEIIQAGRAEKCSGKIVNFSSISGRRGRSLQVHYASSKAAAINITQSAALAFASYHINVNCIAPGMVLTPMWDQNAAEKSKISGLDPQEEIRQFVEKIPLKRTGTVEEIARVAAFLCSPDSDYITGQTLNVDGGFEMN